MNQRRPTRNSQKDPVCQVIIYSEGICTNDCIDVPQLMTCARTILESSSETADDSLLLAKATYGSKSLLFSIDRDNYEFSLRMPGGRQNIAWGTLSAEFKNVSFQDLKKMMSNYLVAGIPLLIPGRRRHRTHFDGHYDHDGMKGIEGRESDYLI